MQPDLEIYLKKVSSEAILAWLAEIFQVTETRTKGQALEVSLIYGDQPLACVIVERAVKGGYTSLWFKQNRTPWHNDEACASDAFARFSAEIRCSSGGWRENAEETAGWYRFTDKGRSLVNWLS